MKDKLEDGNDFQHFNFYAFREPINDPADNIQKTNFFFEGGDLELWTDSFTITIDGEKMERNFHGFYQFKKNGRYNDGDIVKVKINHSTWGNLEFDYLFPDKPDTAYFRPELADWIDRVGDNNMANDSITVLFPTTNYCNKFLGAIFLDTSYPNDTNFSSGEYINKKLFYVNSPNNPDWNNIKTEFLNGTDIIMLNIFGWENILNWDNYCQITASCITKRYEYITYTLNNESARARSTAAGKEEWLYLQCRRKGKYSQLRSE